MPYTINISLKGFQEFEERLQKAPFLIREVKDRMLNTAALMVEGEARKKAPINTGILRGSITHTVNPDAGTARVGTNIKYAPYVEYGTRPHFPPLSPIRAWAARKLGNRNAAYMIARKIARRGTKGQFYMKAGFTMLQSRIEDVKRIGLQILRGLSF